MLSPAPAGPAGRAHPLLIRLAVLLLVPLAITSMAVRFAAPARANSFPGLVEQRYTRIVEGSGDAYTLTARLAIEVDTAGTNGRLRFHLTCTFTDSDTGRTSPNGCDFRFSSGDNAFWCDSPSPGAPATCVGRHLDPVADSSDHIWVGSWHALQSGRTYQVIVDSFAATFNNGSGPVGVSHALISDAFSR